ncbi:MAG: hypothetical protein ACFFDK_03110 [Promethearchaeota archaeon]
MSKLESKDQIDILQCYNCGTEISDAKLKQCPNCGIILDPNHYVKWRNSFIGCICLLCLIPIIIILIISAFSI